MRSMEVGAGVVSWTEGLAEAGAWMADSVSLYTI